MTGTNRKLQDLKHLAPHAPAVILAYPQLGENIGMCARAMLNCGVTELRLVAPRDGWPNENALAAASGASYVLEQARLYDNVADAIADLEYVVATTARSRDMTKDVLNTQEAAALFHKQEKCGILFGAERAGLDNDDVALCNAILNIPLNPGFSSLNLAQAVLLVCYAWLDADNPFAKQQEEEPLATRGEIENLMVRLESALDESGFFRSPEKKSTALRGIRNFFFRCNATPQDIQTLHGVFVSLTGKKTWG